MNACVWADRGLQAEPAVAIAFAFLFAFIVLVILAIKLLICCKIFAKAGYSWALGLLMLIPIVNIIMAFFLAVADAPKLWRRSVEFSHIPGCLDDFLSELFWAQDLHLVAVAEYPPCYLA